MPTGKIIFLNGTSSSGKTTVSLALQERLEQPYIHVALDQFRDGMPARFRGLNSPAGTTGHEGLNVVPVEQDGDIHTDIRFGQMGLTLLKGMRRAIASLAECGNNVIIDDIIMQDDFLDDYLQTLVDYQVIFVGIRCPLEVINQRELQRPGRFPGTAIGQFYKVHAHGIYDVEVDTSTMSPTVCADNIAALVESGAKPIAFEQLRLKRSMQHD